MSIKDSGIFKWERDSSTATKTVTLAAIFLLLAFGMGFAPIEPVRAPEPVRIMPLGDSITEGTRFVYTYRYYLWRMLVDTDANFDFVGSRQNYYSGSSNRPPHEDRAFDSNHEGHRGWCLEAIIKGHWSEGGELSKWLEEFTPDVLLVHLGTNDIGASQSNSSTVKRLEKIIEVSRADNPQITIFFARLIPVRVEDQDARIVELNDRIDALAAEMSTDVSPVIVVDQSGGFDAYADTYDGYHPNRRGARKMAEKWFEVLRPIIEKKSQERMAGT